MFHDICFDYAFLLQMKIKHKINKKIKIVNSVSTC